MASFATPTPNKYHTTSARLSPFGGKRGPGIFSLYFIDRKFARIARNLFLDRAGIQFWHAAGTPLYAAHI
jgi:hypothetical protein